VILEYDARAMPMTSIGCNPRLVTFQLLSYNFSLSIAIATSIIPSYRTLKYFTMPQKMDPKSTSRMSTLLRYTTKGNMLFFTAFVAGYGMNEYLKGQAAEKIPLAREPGREE
jgi:hypothetical protein